jgi:hypothetical protein
VLTNSSITFAKAGFSSVMKMSSDAGYKSRNYESKEKNFSGWGRAIDKQGKKRGRGSVNGDR